MTSTIALTTPVSGFNDPKLAQSKIGIQLTGNDGVNTPPAHELATRGIISNVHGYMVYGDYDKPAPLSFRRNRESCGV